MRDFSGVSAKSFDGRGNYTLGLHDQLIFPEIDYSEGGQAEGHERDHRDHGAETTIRHASLLKHLGMPFRAKLIASLNRVRVNKS